MGLNCAQRANRQAMIMSEIFVIDEVHFVVALGEHSLDRGFV